MNGHTVTVSGTAAGGNLTIQSGGTLEISGANTLTLTSMTNSGTFTGGSGTVTLTGNFTNNGTFTGGSGTVEFNGGGTRSITGSSATTFNHLTFSGGTTTANTNFTVGGDWTNNAAFAPSSYTVTFGGTSNQNIGGTSLTTFNNLTINNGDGVVSLLRSTSVGGNLAFTGSPSGKIALGDFDLTLSSTSLLSGADAGKYVITNGAGVLTREGVGSTPVVFPIGPTSTSYNPVTVTNTGTNDFSARVQTTFDNAPYSLNEVVDRQWTITTSGSPNATLKFQWASGHEGSSFVRTSPYIGRWNGSTWVQTSATPGDNGDGTYTATASGFTTFSPFGVGNVGALPVELTSFSARLKGADAELKWTTATEANNFGFDIERSADRGDWQRIGFVPGHGNSASPKRYAFTDEGAASVAPTLQYRLKQIDRDGATEYSSVVEVHAGARGYELSANYPNPFRGPTTLAYVLPSDARVVLRLYDLLGTEVATLVEETQSAGSYTLRLDPASLRLRAGQYICVMQADGFSATRTLLYMP